MTRKDRTAPRHFTVARPATSDRRLNYEQAEAIRAKWQAECDRRDQAHRNPDKAGLWPYPVTIDTLAAEYGVTRTIIWGVVSGRFYKHPDRPAHTLHHPNHAGGEPA